MTKPSGRQGKIRGKMTELSGQQDEGGAKRMFSPAKDKAKLMGTMESCGEDNNRTAKVHVSGRFVLRLARGGFEGEGVGID